MSPVPSAASPAPSVTTRIALGSTRRWVRSRHAVSLARRALAGLDLRILADIGIDRSLLRRGSKRPWLAAVLRKPASR